LNGLYISQTGLFLCGLALHSERGNIGNNDTTINTGNAQGVALTAIKGLNQKLDEALKAKGAEIRELKLEMKREIAEAKSSREVEFAELKASLVALQARLDAAAPIIKSVSLVSPP
jgi:hypothetical protein